MSGVTALMTVHAIAAVVSAIALASALRAPGRARLFPFFLGICACVPVLGQAGLWTGVVLPLRRTRQTRPRRAPELTALPALPADPPDLDRPVDAGPVRSILAQGRDVARRMKALTSTRRWDDPSAVPALLAALRDQADDIRLLAYGLLDGRMQRLTKRIDAAGRLRATAEGAERTALDRKVAFETWELVRAGLLRGAAAERALSDALRSTELALSSRPEDPVLQLLRGRILLQLKNDRAAEALRAAVRHGLPMRLVAPYLAEAAFHRRAFPEVPGLLAQSATGQSRPELAALKAFWIHSPEQALQIEIPLRAGSTMRRTSAA